MKKLPVLVTGLVLCLAAMPAISASDAATTLGQCLYRNCSDSDKELLTQWAFVSLGKTEAAKKVVTIPDAKSKDIKTRAKKRMGELVTESCRSEALKAVASDPKNGLKDSVSVLAEEMLSEKLAGETSSLLSSSSVLGGSSGSKVSGKLSKLLK